jgi:hypothetical protein
MVARRLLIAGVALAAVAVSLGVASDGSADSNWVSVALTATGPSPSTFATGATDVLVFDNQDSVAHTVTFPDEHCSFSVPAGYDVGPDGQVVNAGQQTLPPACAGNFTFYAGSYPYTVDGTFRGTIEVSALQRSVTLTASTHTIRRGRSLRLHGRVRFAGDLGPGCCSKAPFPVAIFASYNGLPSPKQIATVPARNDVWHLRVRPGLRTTYIARVSGQLPGGHIWTQRPSSSRPFTVRLGH